MNPEGEMTMKPDYRNWMPKGMIMGLGTAAGVLAAGKRGCSQITAALGPDVKASCRSSPGPGRCGMSGGGGVEPVRRAMFSYEGGRQLSRQIIGGRRLIH